MFGQKDMESYIRTLEVPSYSPTIHNDCSSYDVLFTKTLCGTSLSEWIPLSEPMGPYARILIYPLCTISQVKRQYFKAHRNKNDTGNGPPKVGAHDYGLRSTNCGLLWGIVVHHSELLTLRLQSTQVYAVCRVSVLGVMNMVLGTILS